ncbi:MAG: hypothetical protein JWQ87_4228 [Candidatus Sulfotelmatobacter sp.]|nr:hypothetical protein [Candidatus Sulfotelmatobacter sp.]
MVTLPGTLETFTLASSSNGECGWKSGSGPPPGARAAAPDRATRGFRTAARSWAATTRTATVQRCAARPADLSYDRATPSRAGVDQEQIQPPRRLFENVPDRLPIDARTLHGNAPNAMPEQPSLHGFQILGEGRKHGFDALNLFAAYDSGAHRNTLFVYVQTGAAAI